MNNHAARSARRAFVSLAAAALVGLLFAACGENQVEPLPPDTTPPVVEVLFPTSPGTYDEDGDGLADFRVAYRDSAGAINVAQLTVHSLRPVDGPAAGENLLTAWTVDQRDDTLLVFHETIENLLPSQTNQLVVAVADTAGNATEDTIQITLPYGALHKAVDTGLPGPDQANGLTYCPDDNRLYLSTFWGWLAVLDPDSLTLVATSARGEYEGGQMVCFTGDSVLWMSGGRVQRFNRETRQWLPRVSTSFASIAVAASRADQNLIYVGETNSGTIGLIDRVTATRVGQLLGIVEGEYVFGLAVLPGDEKIYVTRDLQADIGVVDPAANELIGVIRLGAAGPAVGDHLALSRNGRWLYAAIHTGVPTGVVEIDTRYDVVDRRLALPDYRAINVALSPDDQRLFITTQDKAGTGIESENVLFDVAEFQVLAQFPRPRPPGETRWDQYVTFHPNGKLIFVTHNENVDVYLNRK